MQIQVTADEGVWTATPPEFGGVTLGPFTASCVIKPEDGGPGERISLAHGDIDVVEDAGAITITSHTDMCDLAVTLTPGDDHVRIQSAIINPDTNSIFVSQIAPLEVAPGGRLVPTPPDGVSLRIYRLGYQSWSPAGSLRVERPDPRPRFRMIRMSLGNARGAQWGPKGRHWADWMGCLVNPASGHSVLAGALTAERFVSGCELHARAPYDIAHWCYAILCDEAECRPGETMTGETVVLLAGPSPDALAERYADMAGDAMAARIPDDTPSGWCSWYHYFTRVTEDDMRTNIDLLDDMRDEIPIDYVQLDDGYQAAIGDWLIWNEKFPSPPDTLPELMRRRGFRPGLWIAPFIASRASQLVQDHPDWVLRDAKSQRVRAGINPAWKGVVYYALDLTHPGCLDYVRTVVRTAVHEWGYTLLKLDFLFAGCLPGKWHDPHATACDAYRRGLGAIREAAGDKAFLLGCGAPLLPSVGLVDGMRIGPDVAPHWRQLVQRTLAGAPVEPSAETSLHNILTRAFLHRRWWLNDPDCLPIRTEKTRLTDSEVQALAAAMGATNGMLVLSDDMAAVPANRRVLAGALLPVEAKYAHAPPAFTRTRPHVTYTTDTSDGSVLRVAVINHDDAPHTVVLTAKDVNAAEIQQISDVWSGAELFAGATDAVTLPTLDAHGAHYLRVRVRGD